MKPARTRIAQIVAFLLLLFLFAGPGLEAEDVKVEPAAGDALVVTDSTGVAERLRVVESGEIFVGGLLATVDTEEVPLCYDALTARLGNCVPQAGHLFGLDNVVVGPEALAGTTTGALNTAVGARALRNNTEGNGNTAMGVSALYNNLTGFSNVAVGESALFLSDGARNTAVGAQALNKNGDGTLNTAFGYQALFDGLTGSNNVGVGGRALYKTDGTGNVGVGYRALRNNTGSFNVGIGIDAGYNSTTGNYNIFIGTRGEELDVSTTRIGTAAYSNRAFVGGIRGVTTDMSDAVTVYVDSLGQLGTTSSSRRFKEDVRDMGDASGALMELRPVTFRTLRPQAVGERPLEYGLLAEEVASVFPDLVIYDKAGKPLTVRYHLLSSMLLNELQKQQRELQVLRSRLDEVETRERQQLAALSERLRRLESELRPDLAGAGQPSTRAAGQR